MAGTLELADFKLQHAVRSHFNFPSWAANANRKDWNESWMVVTSRYFHVLRSAKVLEPVNLIITVNVSTHDKWSCVNLGWRVSRPEGVRGQLFGGTRQSDSVGDD